MKAQFNTVTRRNSFNELVIESTLMMTDTLELRIYSKKVRGTIHTRASVCKLQNEHGYIIKTHALYTDLNIQVQAEPCNRVTAKKLEEFHAKIDFSSIVTQAREFYNLDKEIK